MSLFNQQQNSSKSADLKADLNSFAFSQKLSRITEKLETKQLSTEEKRALLDATFMLGNKIFFKSEKNLSGSQIKHSYNLRYIEVEYNNIFNKKIA